MPGEPTSESPHLTPVDQWGYNQRRRRVSNLFIHSSSGLPVRVGKAFGRVHHQTYPFGNVLDEAKTYLALSKADVRDIPEISEKIFFGCYVHLRRKFGSDLDNKLLNDTPDWEFRNTLSQQLQLGHSQAHTDDIAVLKERLGN
ncbi:hypothetical protein RSAG8_08624, partial [Rhizoctonia solani AG-8 WAC10335]